ncbi:MAG: hypothetical protein N3E50_02400 [Candidatus Goldbacteria bacterium]|nr:hypothetical protein [Candidatus Goldiibacteriota bacterium]
MEEGFDGVPILDRENFRIGYGAGVKIGGKGAGSSRLEILYVYAHRINPEHIPSNFAHFIEFKFMPSIGTDIFGVFTGFIMKYMIFDTVSKFDISPKIQFDGTLGIRLCLNFQLIGEKKRKSEKIN